MKPILIFLTATLATPSLAEPGRGIEGLLGFTNGDQLHGEYLGFADERLRWLRGDLADHAEFQLSNIRRLILRNGKPESALTWSSQANTVHGDQIPGRIVLLDEDKVVMETEFAGNLSIPRANLGMLAPNPLGGRIFYQGPFTADEWRVEDPASRGARSGKPDDDDEDVAPNWTHAGAAWYWPEKGHQSALVLNEEIPASVIIRCQVSWKSRVSLAVAFHADFKSPPEEDVEEADEGGNNEAQRNIERRRFQRAGTGIYGDVFGNSYILQINSNHAMLYRSVMNEVGGFRVERMLTNFNNVNLGESGSASIEIRASRPNGEISLFVNDEFVAQWSEIGHIVGVGGFAQEYAGLGGGFGFLVQSPDSAVRISDVLIAEWNGMPDAARSMQSKDQDIVLLSNGTDRFSGKVKGINGARVMLEGRYGDFTFPLDEVAEIRFARNTLAEAEPAPANTILLRMQSFGLVAGVPISGDDGRLQIEHPSCGTIDVDLDPVVIMEMQPGESFLDAWDPEF